MSSVVTGRRVGAFVVFTDEDGLRHAVRLPVVLALSDTDTCQDTTTVHMTAGRSLLIRASLEQVLQWFT